MIARQSTLGRRELLRGGVGLGVTALGLDALAACAPRGEPQAAATALPPPETTTIRAAYAACDAPFLMAGEFLRDEGLSSLDAYRTGVLQVATGEGDIGGLFATTLISLADAGAPLVALAGLHPGCLDLWARPGIETISDLKGKTIVVQSKASFHDRAVPIGTYSLLLTLLAYVGIAPGAVNLVEAGQSPAPFAAFVQGKGDAYAAGDVEGALLRAMKVPGKSILDTTVDKPWSQVQCCLLVANRDWANSHPVAARRATRAILRGADAAAKDRHAAARAVIEKGLYTKLYNGAVTEEIVYDSIKDLSYDWRDYDPEETLRFWALRLSEAKLITKTPQQIISESMDLTYFRQLRTELKT